MKNSTICHIYNNPLTIWDENVQISSLLSCWSCPIVSDTIHCEKWRDCVFLLMTSCRHIWTHPLIVQGTRHMQTAWSANMQGRDSMMTSWHGNAVYITGPLDSPQKEPVMLSFDFSFDDMVKKVKQSGYRLFQLPWRSSDAHCTAP